MKPCREWDVLLASLGGVLRDKTEAHGLGFESGTSGRPDFERLEVQALKIKDVAGHPAKLREQGAATLASPPGQLRQSVSHRRQSPPTGSTGAARSSLQSSPCSCFSESSDFRRQSPIIAHLSVCWKCI